MSDPIKPFKLHLGCGKRHIPGFFHIDQADFPHIDHRGWVDDLSLFEAGSVQLIYACHLLEHFERTRTVTVLREWLRVLQPGGIVRVAVPDFDAMCKVYQQTGDLGLIIGPLYGRQDHPYNYHYTVFTEKTLSAVFKEAGFTTVRRWDWRTTEHAEIDDFSQAYIPHMDKDHGTLISLNLEGVK